MDMDMEKIPNSFTILEKKQQANQSNGNWMDWD